MDPDLGFVVDKLMPERLTGTARKSIWGVTSSISATEKDAILDLRHPGMWHVLNPSHRNVLSGSSGCEIMRDLTMMVMIFVNKLAEVKGLPAWTYHMPAKGDAMTYVDMVFPIFLFIMGLSLSRWRSSIG